MIERIYLYIIFTTSWNEMKEVDREKLVHRMYCTILEISLSSSWTRGNCMNVWTLKIADAMDYYIWLCNLATTCRVWHHCVITCNNCSHQLYMLNFHPYLVTKWHVYIWNYVYQYHSCWWPVSFRRQMSMTALDGYNKQVPSFHKNFN